MEKQIKKLKSERGVVDAMPGTNTLGNLGYQQVANGGEGVYNTSPMLKSFIASLPSPEGQ